MADAWNLVGVTTGRVGPDLKIEGEPAVGEALDQARLQALEGL